MIFYRRQIGRFDVLPKLVDSQVLFTAYQEIAGCFPIVSGTAATTRKVKNKIRAHKDGRQSSATNKLLRRLGALNTN